MQGSFGRKEEGQHFPRVLVFITSSPWPRIADVIGFVSPRHARTLIINSEKLNVTVEYEQGSIERETCTVVARMALIYIDWRLYGVWSRLITSRKAWLWIPTCGPHTPYSTHVSRVRLGINSSLQTNTNCVIGCYKKSWVWKAVSSSYCIGLKGRQFSSVNCSSPVPINEYKYQIEQEFTQQQFLKV